ncbi:MAG: multifunctional CCA tRNA nucleotidyl transferase/2'3'-cyclic phosphodiesterase/2'nucleotidase/phosphatase [Steroidobacteraceae bacterium]
MELYLVGGAVRDELLGRPVAERDWVVVGATPQEMERAGFRAVGRDFPVYLHPQTHEEYALARLERKVGPGYRGFTTQSSPDVTLEQDLQRRDLTINAIARAQDGRLVDPFGGQRDLALRVLRHVSGAFVEDPVRILRVARFAARFAGLGFTVAPETQALMRQMVDNGEVRALVPERLWRELERALDERHPEQCFDTLAECGALRVLMPELPWRAHERRALQAAVALSPDAAVRFAALLADVDPQAVGSLCDRLRVPNDFRELALLTARQSASLAQAWSLDPDNLLRLLETADAFRRQQRFAKLLLAARADEQARSQDLIDAQPPRAAAAPAPARARAPWQMLQSALAAANAVVLPAWQVVDKKGPEIGAALRAARLARLDALLHSH